MKISALILAHNNLNFLNRLCNKLSPHFNIYIHLDKKCNESIPETLQNAHFAKKRYDINWGSYEMIEATYALLEAAYNDDCEYFILLSGADYPIKPIIDIKTFFENHANISFIAHAPLPVEGLKEGGFDRLWYYWMSSKKSKYASINRYIHAFQRVFHLHRPTHYNFHIGSQWWNINRAAAAYLLNLWRNDHNYNQRFRYTGAPDELFFQTALANSALPIVNKNLRYIHWTLGDHSPKTLTVKDYDAITQSDAFFARKFDANQDSAILNQIDELLL